LSEYTNTGGFYNFADRRASEAGDILVAHSASCGCKFKQKPKPA